MAWSVGERYKHWTRNLLSLWAKDANTLTLSRTRSGHILGEHADAWLQQAAGLCLFAQILLGQEGCAIAAVLQTQAPFRVTEQLHLAAVVVFAECMCKQDADGVSAYDASFSCLTCCLWFCKVLLLQQPTLDAALAAIHTRN